MLFERKRWAPAGTRRLAGRLLLIVAVQVLLFSCALESSAKRDGGSGKTEAQVKPDKIPFPAPVSHRAGWMSFHGLVAGSAKKRMQDQSCLTCHAKQDCISCHRLWPPADHISTWRTLTHGIESRFDRRRCLTCHRQSYCVRCHNETAPRSHQGNWQVQHCLGCHVSPSLGVEDGCSACHKTSPH